jgi:hypothetical protein
MNNQAGAFSPLTTTIGRGDGEQEIGALKLTMPPGEWAFEGECAGVREQKLA